MELEFDDIIQPPAYLVDQVHPSLGLAGISRDGDGLLLDFFGRDTSTALRIAVFAPDGQKMLAELQHAVELLSRQVQSGSTNGLN